MRRFFHTLKVIIILSLSAIIASLLLFDAYPAIAETTYYYVGSKGSDLNVRADKSEQAEIIGTLEGNAPITVDTWIDGRWLAVPSGKRWGWVCRDYLSLEPPFSRKAIVVANGRVAMRAWPAGDRVCWLEPGAQVTAQARMMDGKDEWLRVNHGKRWGWVRGDLLEITEGEEE